MFPAVPVFGYVVAAAKLYTVICSIPVRWGRELGVGVKQKPKKKKKKPNKIELSNWGENYLLRQKRKNNNNYVKNITCTYKTNNARSVAHHLLTDA